MPCNSLKHFKMVLRHKIRSRKLSYFKVFKGITAMFSAIDFLQFAGFPSNIRCIKNYMECKMTPKQYQLYEPYVETFLNHGLAAGLLTRSKGGNYRFPKESLENKDKYQEKDVRRPKRLKSEQTFKNLHVRNVKSAPNLSYNWQLTPEAKTEHEL